MPTIINGKSVDFVINEGSTFDLVFGITDKDGLSVIPTSVSYRIDDVGSNAMIRDWTTASPADPVVISLTSADTVIVKSFSQKELREVTIRVVYSSTESINTSYFFGVQNLKYI